MFRSITRAKAVFKPAQSLRRASHFSRPSEDSHIMAYVGSTAALGFCGMLGYMVHGQEIHRFEHASEAVLVSTGAALIAPLAIPAFVVLYGLSSAVFYAFGKDPTSPYHTTKITQY